MWARCEAMVTIARATASNAASTIELRQNAGNLEVAVNSVVLKSDYLASTLHVQITSRAQPDTIVIDGRLRFAGGIEVFGDATTTIGCAPVSRAAAMTQSTMRWPSSGCRCFGVADFMRVPSPPARTTAAVSGAVTVIDGMAGAPGFEPGIAGPKPAALPLGYAPLADGEVAGRRV